MPGFLSRIFRRRAVSASKVGKGPNGVDVTSNGTHQVVEIDPWEKTSVRREDAVDLLKACCDELKLRGLDTPLFLLPFRPSSDLSSTKTFIRRYFQGGTISLQGQALIQELRLTDVLVLAGILRWLWSRLDGGIVGWEAYDLFAKAEQDANYSRDAFNQLIPLSVESELHTAIILDFFAFLASVAAHAKSNGFSGSRLARIAGWYTFNINGSSAGFVDGYKNWEKAANATEHLFLAYLRSIAPTPGQISAALPLSLSTLLSQTSYPPTRVAATPIAPGATSILRITLSVRNISPTPFALLDRLARHSFIQTNPNERGDALECIIEAQTNHNDPTRALTDECLRVLRLISATNESDVLTAALLRTPNSLEDKTWTRFADLGFEGLDPASDSEEDDRSRATSPAEPFRRRRDYLGLNRPKTPSWGDFLVSGFSAEGSNAGFTLPPDKLLPPINTTTLASGSGRRSVTSRDGPGFRSNLHELEKGEVKTVERSRVDDALWSVWMESLCGEEIEEKKAVFGRCVIAETKAADSGRRWIVVEEIVKGAEITPELLPPVTKNKKISKKAKKAAQEEELAKKKSQQRRSTSDLIGRHHEDGGGTLVGREMRAQALAKQSATLRTIKEKEREGNVPEPPRPRRKSVEYNGRPSVLLGAEVTRAMKWADGNLEAPSQVRKPVGGGRLEDRTDEKMKVVEKVMEKPKVLPEKPQPQLQSQPQPTQRLEKPQPQEPRPETVYQTADLIAPPPPPPVAKKEPVEEIAKPKELPKVQPPRSITPEPTSAPAQLKVSVSGPVLLSPDSAGYKSSDRTKSPPSKFKKFFGGGKSKEEKAAKRASRVSSPIPPSPTPPVIQPKVVEPPTPEPRAPSPIPEAKHWDDHFDGTHREEEIPITPMKPDDYARVVSQQQQEDYRPATPPPVPTFRAEIPVRTSEDEDRDRWAQIRKAAGQRVMNRNVAPPPRVHDNDDEDIMDVNIPRVRQPTTVASPKRVKVTPKADEEEEESVDARVARIRKRVQELTAGMGDD